ncbi:hypothetical protein JCM10212_006719 [Sporobolomyces blumeae]
MPPYPIVPSEPDVFSPTVSTSSFASSPHSRSVPRSGDPLVAISSQDAPTRPDVVAGPRRVRNSLDEFSPLLSFDRGAPRPTPSSNFVSPPDENDPRPTFASDPRSTGFGFPPPRLTPSHSPFDHLEGTSKEHSPRPFDPVVGGSSLTSTLRRARDLSKSGSQTLRGPSASLPITPCRVDLARRSASAFSPTIVAPASSTWPLGSSSIARSLGNVSEQGSTPTRATVQEGVLLIDNELRGLQPEPLMTRYVLVEGVDRNSHDHDFRQHVINPCLDLSLKRCFTSRLRSDGIVVLVFSDVRDAALAVDRVMSGDTRTSSGLAARCIERDAFEQLYDLPTSNPLLSRSQGVVVSALSGAAHLPTFNPLPLVSCYGDIRTFRQAGDRLFVVEYFDDRCADKVSSALDGKESAGWRFSCSFEPTVARYDSILSYAVPSLHLSSPQFGPESPVKTSAPSASCAGSPSSSFRLAPLGPTPPRSYPRAPRRRPKLPPAYGIVRDDQIPAGNVIRYEKIENGSEVRTTLMLKNIPNKLNDQAVMKFITDVVGNAFDFFYLRTDYTTDCNVGYGFVNFTSMSALLEFCKKRLGTRWNLCHSDKLCILSFANIQGKASLVNHFRNSSVLDQDESRRPKLFVTSGLNAGQPEPFPTCDDPVRKMRSALNATNVGLFPSQKPVFKIAQALESLDL